MELTRNLRYGMAGEDVAWLKARLLALGMYGGQVTTLTNDRFGSQTKCAVKAFQAEQGLLADGIMGPLTFAALNGATDAAAAASSIDRGEIPSNIGDTAAGSIASDLARVSESRKAIVLDALQFAYDPKVPVELPLSLYIRGGNLYNADLLPNVITLARIASGASRQPEYYDGGRREMMERAVRANPSITGADCSGGVVGLLRHARVASKGFDLSANGFFASASCKKIEQSALLPADFLHKNGHIGLYAGGGYAVEWMGGAYGCQLTRLSARRGWNFVTGRLDKSGDWTGFLQPDYYK
ncbi:MAG: peptidoglycan-binding domain-containing protein [Clostridiaceae bacterium]